MDDQQLRYLGEQLAFAMHLGMVFAVIVGLCAGGIVRLIRDAYYEWKCMRRWRAFRRRQLARVRL